MIQVGFEESKAAGARIAREIRAKSMHPAVLAAGLRPLLNELAAFVELTDQRLGAAESRMEALEAVNGQALKSLAAAKEFVSQVMEHTANG